MATREYFGLESITQFEGHGSVQRVVSFLRSDAEDPWSFASLSEAVDISEEGLRKEFSTEEALAEMAWELWPHIVLAALSEALRTAGTGREAIHGLLETAISLQSGYRGLREIRNADRSAERRSEEQVLPSCGRVLEIQIQDRFERSVHEGELPESANVRSLSALCSRLVSGFLVCAEDEMLAATLLDSVKLFVDGLGFHAPQPAKRRRRRLTPVLAFAQRGPVL